MTESSHMVEIQGSFDPVLIPFSSFSPFSILGGPKIDSVPHHVLSLLPSQHSKSHSAESQPCD